MHRWFKERFCSWKEIFWRKAVAIVAALYALLGFWDLFKSELLPEKYQSLTVVKLTPHLSWHAWLISLLVIVIVILLEGAHAAIRKREKLIADLQPTSKQLAEEDPRVYLDPINSEFVSHGYIPFKVSNKGQRINPAQGITVQPIQCAPSIKFGYVDRLDMNEEKRLIPTVEDGDIFPRYSILPELRKAWENAHAAGGFDDAEFPFEIKIEYRDAGHRTFKTTVSVKYCPVEEEEASRSVASGQPREYAILKVTNTEIKRLS
jgi:hypothetical protein